MEATPHFDFRDVLRAPAAALSAKQILLMSLALLVALVVYDIVTYVALVFAGEPLPQSVSAFGFFPFEILYLLSGIPVVIYWLGVALAVMTLMLGFFAVSAINIEAIRGNRFMSPGQAIRFAWKRLPQIFLSELSILAFVGVIVLLFALLGLVSRLPLIGEWLFVVLLAVPNFIIALFAIFIVFVLVLTVPLLPAVAAAERRGETFTAILETFSTIILQPARWFGYTAYSLVAAKFCGFIYAYFAFRAIQFLVWAAALGGGERLTRLAQSGLAHLPVRSDLVRETFNVFPGVPFGVGLWEAVGYRTDSAISYVTGFMLFLVLLSVLGYSLAVVAAGQARGYVALKYIKDRYSIAEEESLFFKDEPINEPAEQPAPADKTD
ncbi:MAG: hypothetical protein AB1772_04445 [Candidatus Zixiibacteriota bacterium]